jgi:hypothetical protein
MQEGKRFFLKFFPKKNIRKNEKMKNPSAVFFFNFICASAVL